MTKERKPNPARDVARQMAREISKLSADDRAAIASRFPAIVTIEGRTLSPTNSVLVIRQSQGATVVGGFKQWIKAGRAVRKGERAAAYIFVPSTRKGTVNWMTGERDDEAEQTVFIMAPVFDVSQTEELAAAGEAQAA